MKKLLEYFWDTKKPTVEVFIVSTQCPIFWPRWAYEYLVNNPYETLHPGDRLMYIDGVVIK